MSESFTLKPEKLEKTIRLRAENDTGEPAGMVIAVPTREGGTFNVPVLEDWTPLEEKPEGELGNTLLSVCPVAEIHRKRPIKVSGVTVFGGRAVSTLRPGYLYVFRGQTLWREFEVSSEGTLSEIDLTPARQQKADRRSPVGKPVTDFLVPVFLQNRFELSECRIAFSEIQWPWAYIQKLEGTPAVLEKRALSIAPAWAASNDDGLTFDSGFPAAGIRSVPNLRPRDLGIELMLQDPSAFTPAFTRPNEGELVSRLVQRWGRIPGPEEGSDVAPPDLTLKADPSDDTLAEARAHSAIVCVAIPDPLFRLRHALAQLHLALHYLDAIDLSLKNRPLIHSATLIRQALFDPHTQSSDDQIETLRAAVDRNKLHKVLDHSERQKALEEISAHLEMLEELVNSGEFDAVCDDYLNHTGLGPCEAFALQADLLNLTQQLPGVLNAHGLKSPGSLSRLLKRGLGKNPLIDALAEGAKSDRELPPLLARLRELAGDQNTLSEERLTGAGLSSISMLAQQLTQEEGGSNPGNGSSAVPSGAAGTAAGMVQTALGGWSAAVLKAVEGLRQSGDLGAIKLDRVFTSVKEAADIADPNLGGELQVMHRGEVDLTRYSIVGVHGNGISFGLTDEDRKSEALTRRNDYLFADRTDAAGSRVASTSPGRLVDEGGETLVKAAAHTWVFVLPVDHPEARKFSALRIDWAKKAKGFADGPGFSKVLVGLAVFNLASEMWSVKQIGIGEVSKVSGAFLDLFAASMKLYVASSSVSDKVVSKVILRPLFEIKSLPVMGPLIQKRLVHVGAGTIVRFLGLVNFFAGGVMVGVSAWDYRNSISRGDLDAAFGHGLAVAGGSVFLASPLLSGLLVIPGWGWALFGLGAVLGGSIFAAFATDSEIERVLKQGPLGVGPDHKGLPAEDSVYFPQLLSQFSAVTVSAKRYGDLSGEEQALFANHKPSANDYRVTVRSPLISRFKLGQKAREKSGGIEPDLRLGIQELEYTHSTLDTSAGLVDEFNLTGIRPLKRVTAWVPVLEDHAVHFLIERNLAGGETHAFGHGERRTISLRVVLQARIDSEIGAFRLPMPVLDAYEPFDPARHGELPDKQRRAFNPFDNEPKPYWIVKEVSV
ncbi:toxin VasX [Marinobacter sp. SS8-8]|uniref:toxin VasX n=3 Tax=Marinobacter TaxID=2742 RepID=UPI0026DF787B|nr:toxin VasX [Marinobacter sp. SS8-8]